MAICSNCTTNVHLKARIEKDGIFAQCRECRMFTQRVFEVRHLAPIFANAIQQNFELNPQTYLFHDEDTDYTTTHGDSLETVVSEMLEQPISFFDELIKAIVETDDDYRPQDGEVSFFEEDAVYAPVEWGETVDYFTPHWREILGELKHKRRFFSESVHTFFERLFEDVDKVRVWKEDAATTQHVVHYAEAGMKVYRGRIIEPEHGPNVMNQPFKEVGPAPRNKARPGRMSPEGVVALYCAMDEDTAIAELRPAIGNTAAVIALSFTRKLRLLDFERLERVLDAGWGSFIAFDHNTIRSTRVFLRKLHDSISQPVVPGHEADYLITQTMAEYLAHVHHPQFDGIMFKSVQRAGGMNIVLFSDRDLQEESSDTFPVEYVPASLKFHKTQRVVYEHELVLPTHSSKNGLSFIPNDESTILPLR